MAPHTDILIIGTEPPCPRCDLMRRLVSELAPRAASAMVRHCAFDAPEAIDLGRQLGRKVGTAKHVAKDSGVAVDWGAVYEVIERKRLAAVPPLEPADAWSPELDELLEPCRAVAESTGYLMTPVLVVNGRVVHHGNVPPRERLSEWIAG